MRVILIAVLLSLGCRSRSSVEKSRAARALRQTPVLEVAPAPLPSALPLIGVEGRDADGYPTRYVDRPALRSLLAHQRFQTLSDDIEQFQTAFESDSKNEYWPMDAGDAFHSAEPELERALDAWVAATPKSFAPYLARGSYRTAVAGALRGGKRATDTPDDDLDAMADLLPRALDDLKRAVELRPKLVAAMRLELQAMRFEKYQRAKMQPIIDLALAVCPDCFQIRVTHLFSLTPRWGGSYAKMAAFAVPGPGKQRLLPGYIDDDKAKRLAEDTRFAEALQTIDRACALGDHWEFMLDRARIRLSSGDSAGALADVDRAVALRPGLPEVLFERAEIEARERRWEPAGRDLLEGLRSNPTDSLARFLFGPVVKGLVADGWTAHNEKKRDDAVRLLDLAAALAPTDRDIEQRRSWAILGKDAVAGDTGPLEAAVSQHPDDFRAVQQLDYAWAQGGKFDQIVALWTRYLQAHPDNGAAYLERGGAYHHLGKRPEALADAVKACELGVTKGCEVAKRLR